LGLKAECIACGHVKLLPLDKLRVKGLSLRPAGARPGTAAALAGVTCAGRRFRLDGLRLSRAAIPRPRLFPQPLPLASGRLGTPWSGMPRMSSVALIDYRQAGADDLGPGSRRYGFGGGSVASAGGGWSSGIIAVGSSAPAFCGPGAAATPTVLACATAFNFRRWVARPGAALARFKITWAWAMPPTFRPAGTAT
jgi:hypothetical protein